MTTSRVELVEIKDKLLEERRTHEETTSGEIVIFAAETTDIVESTGSAGSDSSLLEESVSTIKSENADTSQNGGVSEGTDSSGPSTFGNPAKGESSGDIVTISTKTTVTSLPKAENAKSAEEKKIQNEKDENERKKEGFVKQALSCVRNKKDFDNEKLKKDLEEVYAKLKTASFTEKSEIVAHFIKEKNIDVDDEAFKALIERYIKYEVEYEDSFNSSILYKKNLSVSDAQKAAKILIGIHNGEIKIDNNDRRGQILKAFCSNIHTSKSIDKAQYTELLTNYIYERSRIETIEELEKLDNDFIDVTDTEIMSNIKSEYEKYTYSRLLTPDDVTKQRECALQAKKFLFECMVASARNEEEKKSTYRTQEKSIKSTQKRFTELTEKYITKEHTKEQAEEILKEAGKIAEEQAKSIAASMEINGMDENFKAEMHFKLLKTIKHAKEYTIKFIKKFFESEKGKAILNYTRQRVKEVKEKKRKLTEAKEKSEKAAQEAKELEVKTEEIIAKAKKEENKASELAEKYGLKDLTFDKLFKFAKNVSTKLAFDLLYSQEDKKKAQNAQFEADMAKEHAYSQEKIARINLSVARAQMQAAMINVQTNLFIAMSQS